ncbi:carboxy terminal-processing peptidase [Lewinella sp. W8]|uniref:carboxy terminal-processing peptidase n=1 Tax=Lewinella sp. W8 TaxID=2528208 RepID=UPI0010683EEA|nr:carboxy terminal-processing peptidase [Lewinella sp. W8]MTB52745.1 tail-specific protease [Lewinella sp. W8]
MKSRGTLLLSALFVVSAFIAAVLPERTPPGEKESVIVQVLLRNLERFHYQPMEIDDDFSERAYDYYLNDMDGARLFFTQEDIEAFAPHRLQIDDQANAGQYDFFDLVQDHWVASLDKTEVWYQEILNQPFDLKKKGEIEMRDDDSGWVKNDKALKQYWEDYLKRDVLRQIVDKQKELEKDESGEPQPSLAEIEADIREKTLERYDKWFERMREAKLSIRRSQYLNALTAMFDPHTQYLRPKDKESFDIRFSGRLEGIGATLVNDEDYTKVNTIVVGGPAWKQKELAVDDLIMAVRQEDEEEFLDIKDMLVEDVVQHIRGDKGTTVTLKVKKPDGSIQEISIVRDIVVIDERYAKSLIIGGEEEGDKVGYINLPSFYADFNNEDGRFSAKDVKTEIEKLNDKGVDGIILDLRGNGGGSLSDVVDMTGFFIPEGPVVQVAGRGGRKQILRDKDPRVQYDGPLVVLVDQGSASASEIIAAALQDYNRAVIVGSESTFGKGTVQRFFDLDRTVAGLADVKPLGTLKLTMQKFYRINGGSTQLRGVVPDIILPDSRSLLETGEKRQTSPLAWTQIDPADYGQDVYQIGQMEELKRRSAARVASNGTFGLIQENAKRVKRQSDRKSFPLSLADYQSMDEAAQQEADQYKGLFDEVVNPYVYNLELDMEEIEIDESKVARNEEFKKNVSKDVYIREAINILGDMLELESK